MASIWRDICQHCDIGIGTLATLASSRLPGQHQRLRRLLGERVLRVTVKPFMDMNTMIEERLTQCCVHVATVNQERRRPPVRAVLRPPGLGAAVPHPTLDGDRPMTDPRLVEPQRVPPDRDGEDACAHVYWCRTRITVVSLLVLLLVGVVAGPCGGSDEGVAVSDDNSNKLLGYLLGGLLIGPILAVGCPFLGLLIGGSREHREPTTTAARRSRVGLIAGLLLPLLIPVPLALQAADPALGRRHPDRRRAHDDRARRDLRRLHLPAEPGDVLGRRAAPRALQSVQSQQPRGN